MWHTRKLTFFALWHRSFSDRYASFSLIFLSSPSPRCGRSNAPIRIFRFDSHDEIQPWEFSCRHRRLRKCKICPIFLKIDFKPRFFVPVTPIPYARCRGTVFECRDGHRSKIPPCMPSPIHLILVALWHRSFDRPLCFKFVDFRLIAFPSMRRF